MSCLGTDNQLFNLSAQDTHVLTLITQLSLFRRVLTFGEQKTLDKASTNMIFYNKKKNRKFVKTVLT